MGSDLRPRGEDQEAEEGLIFSLPRYVVRLCAETITLTYTVPLCRTNLDNRPPAFSHGPNPGCQTTTYLRYWECASSCWFTDKWCAVLVAGLHCVNTRTAAVLLTVSCRSTQCLRYKMSRATCSTYVASCENYVSYAPHVRNILSYDTT